MPDSVPLNNKLRRSSLRTREARDRALQVLSAMRREHLSLSAASRRERIKPATVLRYVGSAVRQDKPSGRFRATAGDRFRRDLRIPTPQGYTTVPVYGSKKARFVSDYLNAVGSYLRSGSRAELSRFRGKTLKVRGQTVELLTDATILSRLAEADALRLDQLYASLAGTP